MADNTQFTGVVGTGNPSALSAGVVNVVALDRQGALRSVQSRAKYAQLAAQNCVFSTNTASAGTTVVAANVAPPAAAAATVLSLYNPVGNTFDFEILKGDLAYISGTPGAQPWIWCVSASNTAALVATTTAAAAPIAGRAGTSTAKAFTQAAVTGGLVHVNVRMFPSVSFAGAIAATTPNQVITDLVDGSIIVPPGSVLTLAPGAVGTSVIVAASITWAEIPIVSSGGY